MTITYEYSNLVTTGSIALLSLGSLFSLSKPSRMLFLYVALLVVFTGALYGTTQSLNEFAKESSIFTIYTRGMGKFSISLLNIYLALFMIFSFISFGFFKTKPKLFSDLPSLCITLLAVYYVGYLSYGLFNHIDLNNAVAMQGGFGLLNLFMMYIAVRISLKTTSDLYGLEKLFIVCCLLMAVYGLARLPLGGDPANYYSLYERKNVRLTFFDFGQAALFCVAFALVFLRQEGKLLKSFAGSAMAGLFLANILLSFRRTAWFGLVLIFVWFLLTLDVKRKLLLLIVGFMVLIAGSAIYTSRFAASAGKSGATAARKSLTADITDSSGKISFKKGRFSELYEAVMAANTSPLIGLGPWGINESFIIHHGDKPVSFVHSSIVHVYLKMGLLGLTAYLGLLVGFPLWWIRQRWRSWNDPRLRTIGDAFFCGYLFWLPDICFGTPLISYRHTQLLALFFAVPAAAWTIDSRMQQKKKVGQLTASALAVGLAFFCVTQTPSQAEAATSTASQPEISSIHKSASSLLQAQIGIGRISEAVISPMLIGTNLHVGYERDINTNPKKNQLLEWQPSGTVVFNTDMLNHCRNIGVKILRFPGGETSNAYHWRQGVGPLLARPAGQDEYGKEMRNFFGTVEFADAAKAIGAEMIITTNYKTGTLQEAANWVEYCNAPAPSKQPAWTEKSYAADEVAPTGYFAWLRSLHGRKEPLGVKYWEIGNEIYFHKNSSYIGEAKQYSLLMKKKDPSIKIGLSSDSLHYMSQQEIKNLALPSGAFDYLSVHYYGLLKTLRPLTSFYSNAESTRSFDVNNADTYAIRIEAFGSKALEWPHMALEVNGTPIQRFTVSSSNLQSYTANVQLSGGTNTLSLKLDNDRALPGIGDTNLYIKGVTISTANDQPIEIWNTPPLEYSWLFSNNTLIEQHIQTIRQVFPDMALMITEGNTGYGIIEGLTDATESRKLKAGLWIAGLFNSLIRNDAFSFDQWALYGSNMGFALVWPDGHVAPSYFVLKMYSIHAGQRRVDVAVTSPTFDAPLLATTPFGKATTANPFIDAVASLNEGSNELAVTMVNRHANRSVQTQLSLGDLRLTVPETTFATLKAKNNEGLEANNETTANNVDIATKTVQFATESEILTFTLEPSSATTLKCKIRR